MLEVGGRFSVMVEASWLTSMIGKGPSNLGMNIVTHFSPLAVYCHHLFCVESMTQSPMSRLRSGLHAQFANAACEIFAFRRLSCASKMSSCSLSISSQATCSSGGVGTISMISGGMSLRLCPSHS